MANPKDSLEISTIHSCIYLPTTFNCVNCCCINVRALDMTVQLHKIVHKKKQSLYIYTFSKPPMYVRHNLRSSQCSDQ